MEAATGLTHEAVVRTGTLHNTQPLAIGIDLVQGGQNRLAILGRDQRISRTEHTGEPRLNPRQQGQRRLTAAGAHPTHTGAVEINGMINPGQRGCQTSVMPPNAEAHHMDGGVGLADP